MWWGSEFITVVCAFTNIFLYLHPIFLIFETDTSHPAMQNPPFTFRSLRQKSYIVLNVNNIIINCFVLKSSRCTCWVSSSMDCYSTMRIDHFLLLATNRKRRGANWSFLTTGNKQEGGVEMSTSLSPPLPPSISLFGSSLSVSCWSSNYSNSSCCN